MGNIEQSYPQPKHFTVLDYGYCKVWQSKINNIEVMEQYSIQIQDQKTLENYKSMWQLRTQHPLIINVLYFSHSPSNQFCGTFQYGNIMIERIPYRLSQFSDIDYLEIISILKVCIRAYQLLFDQYGLFIVRSTMIGLTNQRKIKVWYHTDYSLAQPQNPFCNNLSQMILSIIYCIEINGELPERYPKFSQFLFKNINPLLLSFEYILKALDSYIDYYQLNVREELPELTKYLRQAEGWEEMSYTSNFMKHMFKENILQNQFEQNIYLSRARNKDKSMIRRDSNSSQKTVKNYGTLKQISTKNVNQIMKEKYKNPPYTTSMKNQINNSPKCQKSANLYIDRPLYQINEKSQNKPSEKQLPQIQLISPFSPSPLHKQQNNRNSIERRIPHNSNIMIKNPHNIYQTRFASPKLQQKVGNLYSPQTPIHSLKSSRSKPREEHRSPKIAYYNKN